jgi:hypothetical protein
MERRKDRIDHRDARRTALILSALFWCILLYPTNFDAAMTEKLRSVLGDRPAGLPYDLFILLFTFQLSVPMIFFFRHLLITVTYARKRRDAAVHIGHVGAVAGLIGYLRFLLRDSREGTAVRRSKLITFGGILYLLCIVAWWIWWTDRHGI